MLAARIAEKECNGSSTQEVIWINQCKCIASDRKQSKKTILEKKIRIREQIFEEVKEWK